MSIKEWIGDEVTIKIDYVRCIGHADCVEVCPSQVFEMKENKSVPVNINECIQCCSCVEACPEEAIVHSACE